MKKTYITPEMLTVKLGTLHMMAESLFIDKSGSEEKTIKSSNDILVKETTDVNVWDKEW